MAVQTPAPERAASRRKLAAQKKALPDGSFPMPDASYVGKAIRAVGRAAPGKRPALARLIRKRAHQLGKAGMAKLKGSWADNTQSKKDMANALYGTLVEFGGYDHDSAMLELSLTLPLLVVELAGYGASDSDSDDATPKKKKRDVSMLTPKGKAVMKRLMSAGKSATEAYDQACYHTPGGMKSGAAA